MASAINNLSDYNAKEIQNASNLNFGIIVSTYNEQITFALRDACVETLLKHGTKEEQIIIEYVPGAFELPVAAKHLAKNNSADAVIILGCVIKGGTDHDKYINHAVAQGIMQLNLQFDIPFIFGLLTPNTEQQAKDRAGGKQGNKGVEAAVAAIKMAHLLKKG